MIALLLSLVVAGAMTWWMVSGRNFLMILDYPNERSLHTNAVPRCGGIAILLGVTAGWGVVLGQYGMPEGFIWVSAAAFIVAMVSLLDDLFELPVRIRLMVHLAAAAMILAGGFVLPWGWVGLIASFLAIVWMLNLYNFMDGMDGFAGGMASIGFGFLGLVGWLSGVEVYALLCWTVSVSALGFLLFNFPPARIFMGDTGSTTLGLLAAALSLWGIKLQLFPIWLPIMVFSPFIVDATVTLGRRIINRERIWEAHCSHYYQRLVRLGWGHKRTVLFEYGLMLAAGSTALLAHGIGHPAVSVINLFVWTGVYVGVGFFVSQLESGIR
ncbi:UDP-N-acetylmuramyl pentapeptide phosphotransferase/UDP-N-acetylglucosamine-1-phosphate transferase [Mariprofundus ferrinatatus]|uniref:UDP-N-acetylmuramyl pentapeptide phosphotransferase/UDP-N-acetylglucosamine-1-phosphate transferase n=1 Tax=Mariprofundus ferrinatatus TaxID=1921087 RepID=A0A2K8L289_9PROT|nr:glycosyltransferase family 4 protein [Mariprofundus ferrinatatus]ATX81435.1 UDP-N-acetylmuramyl pentapeptide phosphotransferase/UDP-N-acetylglucosamine-1-phosphate transferase [Mariprofundus ferrinatatus]